MYDLKWFKLDCNVFDNYKLKYCLMADNGLYYQLVWIKLLCEAAKRNDGGKIYIKRGRYIDLDQLAHLLDMDKQIVGEAICVFEDLGMIKYDNDEELVVKGFTEYQHGESVSSDGARELEYTDREEEDSRSFAVERAPEKSREDISLERKRESGERFGKADQTSKSTAAEDVSRRVKIKDMSSEERREYDRLAKKRARAKAQKIDGYATEQSNTEDVQNEDVQNFEEDVQNVQNVQNANNSVQNPVQMSKIGVQNVQNECPKNLEETFDNVQNSPKNIFIEENREEENRRDKNRGEENREEKINNNSLSPSQRVEEKNKYGTFGNVFLSNTEVEELRAKLGAEVLSRLIDDLSEHMASTGKTYVSHYATLLRWSKNEYAPKDLYEVVRDSLGSGKASSHIGDTSVNASSSMGQGSGRADSDTGDASAKAGAGRYEENENARYGRGVGFGASSDGWDFLNKKGPRDKPREPKNRYGDFDPEEAMRLAIERTMRECGTL